MIFSVAPVIARIILFFLAFEDFGKRIVTVGRLPVEVLLNPIKLEIQFVFYQKQLTPPFPGLR